jgi:hypothetical protein
MPAGLGEIVMMESPELPSDEDLSVMFWKCLNEINRPYVATILVYLFTCLVFGIAVWKSFAIAAIIGYSIFVRFGRQLLMKVAVLLFIVTIVEWSGVVGHISGWPALARSMIKPDMN